MAGGALRYNRRPLVDWMRGIHDGRITLPTFQRSTVWDIGKVKSLIDSLLRDRPVGALLLMPADKERFHSRPIRGAEAEMPATGGGELVLDGQQRLTALWRAFHGAPVPLFVRIDDWDASPLTVDRVGSASDFGFRAAKDEGRNAVLQFKNRCIPFAVLGIDCVTQPHDAAWQWCNRALLNDGEGARRLVNRIQQEVAKPFRDRGLWHLTLSSDVSREEAINIYIRTNESSAVIRRFDIAVAKYDADTGGSLRNEIAEMVAGMGSEQTLIHRFFDTTEGDDGLIPSLGEVLFKVSCLWCESAPTEGKYTDDRVLDAVRTRREELRDGLLWTLDFYQQEGIRDRSVLPSDVPLRVLPALYPTVRELFRTDEARVRRHLSAYLWRAFLTDRYSRSANTRLQEDYGAMVSKLSDGAGKSTKQWRTGVPIFRASSYPIPNSERLADLDDEPLRSPRTRNSLAKAIFAISLREGRDFATGQPAGSGMDQGWEYHHLFPKDYLKRSGLKSKQFNHGLNQAMVTSKTNSIIRNRPPHEYLAVDGALARAANGEAHEELPRLVESHRIPYAALVAKPRSGRPRDADVETRYREFIKARAEMMETAMKALIAGKVTLTDD